MMLWKRGWKMLPLFGLSKKGRRWESPARRRGQNGALCVGAVWRAVGASYPLAGAPGWLLIVPPVAGEFRGIPPSGFGTILLCWLLRRAGMKRPRQVYARRSRSLKNAWGLNIVILRPFCSTWVIYTRSRIASRKLKHAGFVAWQSVKRFLGRNILIHSISCKNWSICAINREKW